MSSNVAIVDHPANVREAVWSNLAGAETGIAANVPRRDLAVQVSGTIGGATVVVEGSNDGTTWAGVTDGTAAISFTAAGLKRIVEHPLYFRAKTSGGTGSSIAVSIVGTGV